MKKLILGLILLITIQASAQTITRTYKYSRETEYGLDKEGTIYSPVVVVFDNNLIIVSDSSQDIYFIQQTPMQETKVAGKSNEVYIQQAVYKERESGEIVRLYYYEEGDVFAIGITKDEYLRMFFNEI